MVKEAGLTALVLFGLTIGLVGFETRDVPGGVAIRTRFDDVAAVVVIGFIGRIALILLREHRPRPVLIGTVAAAAGMLVLLLSETLFGPHTGAVVKSLIPFDDPVVVWGLFVVTVGFAVRAVFAIRHMASTLSLEERDARMDRIGARVQHAARLIGPVLLALAVVFPFTPMADRQLLDITILVLTYVMLGWGLNIVVGLAGLLDLGYVAFYAVGAYAFALLGTTYDISFWVTLPFAGLMAATAGVLLGFPVLRLRGDYLAIVTLGFGEMIRVILLNWYTFTGGPDGISGIPRPSFFGIAEFTRRAKDLPAFHELFGLPYSPIQRIIFLYYLILALALAVNFFTMRIRRLPVGRAWEALREDEIACRSLGINPRNTKLTAFGIGAMFAGFAGSFFATRQGFISPESFTFIESAVILAIVVLGGFGSQIGVVVAAILLIGLPEFFRELQQYRMLAFGAAMVLIMLWRPAGLLAHREPTLRLFPRGGGPKGAT
ncbi:MAG: high-affinity branched-chain amino acid ABC transporter permease LivM [Alphaproteobacteria bacterium]|nr:MAG: high-affinity branched-chain amino acid ABC transporter permease LivM [Alphaproteobacteria bacterium]